jgi:hypothetical protein
MDNLIIVALVLYFIPSIVANLRRHHNAGAITILNLFPFWVGHFSAGLVLLYGPPLPLHYRRVLRTLFRGKLLTKE